MLIRIERQHLIARTFKSRITEIPEHALYINAVDCGALCDGMTTK